MFLSLSVSVFPEDLIYLSQHPSCTNDSCLFFLKFGKVMYTLLYLKWITDKDLLYSTWNFAQCYVPA